MECRWTQTFISQHNGPTTLNLIYILVTSFKYDKKLSSSCANTTYICIFELFCIWTMFIGYYNCCDYIKR